MTVATITRLKPARSAVTAWLASAAWIVLLGAVSGAACVAVRLFFRLLQWVFVQHTGMLPVAAITLTPGRRVLTPILGAALAMLVVWMVRRFTTSEFRFEEYVEAVRFREGRIAFLPTAWRILSSAFSVATGAAIGREGSMIQFATAVASWIGRRAPIQRLTLARQVACGGAAAVAAAYQAPCAGVFFAAEIVLGEVVWSDVPPLLLASVSGWVVSRLVLGAGPLFPVEGRLQMTLDLVWLPLLAIILGAAGPVYQKLLHLSKAARRLPLALLWGGLAVGLFSLLEPKVWGNGDAALIGLLQNRTTLLAILCLLAYRLAATTLCVGTGTVGGVFTPTLFTGAAIGLAAGQYLHCAEPLLLAVAGMALLMAAVTHAPLMAALMAVELTGQWHLLPVILACNLLACFVARALSRDSLYAVASPEPAL